MNSSNKIQRIVFDVNYPNQRGAVALQNKITAIFNNELSALFDKKLSELTADSYIKAKQIELDLGKISEDDIELGLSGLIEDKLDAFFENLRKNIAAGNTPSGISQIVYPDKVYEYLYYYYKFAYTPWDLSEFSNSQNIVYWINYLSNHKPEAIKSLLNVFKTKTARVRLIKTIQEYTPAVVYSAFFSNSFSSVLIKIHDLIAHTLQLTTNSTTFDYSTLATQLNHFVIHEAIYLAENNMADMPTIEQITQHFYFFVESEEKSAIPTVFSPFVGLASKDIKGTADELKFIKAIETQYLGDMQKAYGQIFETGTSDTTSLSIADSPKFVPINNAYFKQFITKHHSKNSKYINKLSSSIIYVLQKQLSGENKKKVSEIVYGIMLESLKGIALPVDINLWFATLLDNFSYSFGIDANKEIAALLTEELSKDEFNKVQKATALQLNLKTLELTDGGKTTDITIPQALKYFELIASYGFHALLPVFHDPKKSITAIILWLKKEHNTYLLSITNKLQKQIRPLNLWRLKQELDTDIIEIIIPKKYQHPQITLGELLFTEILSCGYIPLYEYQQLGREKVIPHIKDFCDTNADAIKKLLVKHRKNISAEVLTYLSGVVAPDTMRKLKPLIIETIPAKYIQNISGETKATSLIKLQMLLPASITLNLTQKQTTEFIALVEEQIKMRNSNFALLLFSLNTADLKTIRNLLPETCKKQVDTLLLSYKYKYQPQTSEKTADSDLITEEDEKEPFKVLKQGEPSYISNAGLVLLNPFITPLLKKTGLIKDKDFIDNEARVKGMQLMQYIVNKQDKPDEPNLQLNKILVGFDPNMPISKFYDISNEEKEMCDGLIDAIIQHWSALKNTSRDNLRASFFMRNGKIIFEESQWRLKVEQKSIDILIDKLPWSVSMIKYPWMQYTLFTDWR